MLGPLGAPSMPLLSSATNASLGTARYRVQRYGSKACLGRHFRRRRGALPQLPRGIVAAVPRRAEDVTLIVGDERRLKCLEAQLPWPRGVPRTPLLSLPTKTTSKPQGAATAAMRRAEDATFIVGDGRHLECSEA